MKHVTFRIEKEILCKSTQALLTRRFQGQSRDLASQNHGPVPSMIDYRNRTEKGATAEVNPDSWTQLKGSNETYI